MGTAEAAYVVYLNLRDGDGGLGRGFDGDGAAGPVEGGVTGVHGQEQQVAVLVHEARARAVVGKADAQQLQNLTAGRGEGEGVGEHFTYM